MRPGRSCVLLVCASCAAVGPDYEPPAIQTPEAFDVPTKASVSAAEVAEWWRVFGDTELDALVGEVLAANLDLRAAVERIEQGRAFFRAVTGERFPALDASVAVRETQLRGPGSADTGWSLGGSAAWEIDVFGRVRRGVEAAVADVAALAEDTHGVQVALAAEAVATYLQLRSLQERLAIAERNVAGQLSSLVIAEQRFGAGMAAGLDPAQAQVNLSTTESVVPLLRLGLRRALHRLAVLSGRSPRQLGAQFATTRALPPVPPELLVGIPADLLRNRPDIRGLERQLAAQTARIGVATSALYPRLNLTGSFDWLAGDPADLFDDGNDAWSYGLPLSWPVFAGGRLRAGVDAEESRARQIELALRQRVLVAQEEVENALVAVTSDRRQATVLREAVAAAQRSAGLSRELYTSGQSDFQNVLDAERSLFDLEDQLAQAELNILLDLVDLYRAIGGGWASSSG